MSGTRVLEANVHPQLLIDHAFVCSSCTDTRRCRRCARRYYTPRFLVCQSSLQSLQLPRFTSSKLYHSQVKLDTCGQPAGHPGLHTTQ